MPPRIIFKDKICKQCSKKFNRGVLRGGREESPEDFRKRKFCSHQCFGKYNMGERHWYWRGGIKRRPDGYLRYSKTDKFVHRKMVEDFIGRELGKDEFVHHINGDVADNRIGNLQIISNSAHRKMHCVEQQRDGMGRWCRRA